MTRKTREEMKVIAKQQLEERDVVRELIVALEAALRVIRYESAENKYSVIVCQAHTAIQHATGVK